jgi:hypothetical protein
MNGDGSSDEAWDGWYFGTNLVVKLKIGGGFGDWYCEILLWTRGKVKKKKRDKRNKNKNYHNLII